MNVGRLQGFDVMRSPSLTRLPGFHHCPLGQIIYLHVQKMDPFLLGFLCSLTLLQTDTFFQPLFGAFDLLLGDLTLLCLLGSLLP